MADFEDQPNLLYRLAGLALYNHIWLVQRTSRWLPHLAELEGRRQGRKLTAQHPFIFAMWHGQFMLLPLLSFPKYPMQVMVARHGDAAIASQLLKHFDLELIRGAGAGGRKKDRGGSHAIRAAQEALRNNVSVAMTADVPPGPARRAGMGIVTLARVTGRPIVPVAIASSRHLSLNTWSRMTINLPWSDCGAVVGDPVFVPSDLDTEGQERMRQKVEDGLNAATREAYDKVGVPDPLLAARARAANSSSPMLATYRTATRALQSAAPALLAYRERQGKEDPAHRAERMGVASQLRPPGPLAWLHAASVGETMAAGRLIGELKQRYPSLSILLTTGTVTSARLARARLGDSVIHQYIPIDGPAFVARFIEHWRPQLGVFVESEIWPNLVLAAAEKGVPLVVVNGRLSERSFRGWQRRAAMARRLFGAFALVLAQTEPLARRFTRLGARDVKIAGNLKYDAAALPVDAAASDALRRALGGRDVFLAASTHPGEEVHIAQALKLLKVRRPGVLAIIAPRHPGRGEAVAEELRAGGLKVSRRGAAELPAATDDAYVADTIGELGLFYSVAPVAFIGGSLIKHGGQNPVEAIQLGSAVVTGPHVHNFEEAYRALLRKEGCRQVVDAAGLANALEELLGNRAALEAQQRNARSVIAGLGGALKETLAALAPLLAAAIETEAKRAA